MSFDELDFPGESDNDGSRSGSYGMSVCSSGEYVGSVSAVGFGKKIPTGIESLGDVVQLVMFVPIGVKSKGGRLVGSFWCPKS